MYFTSFNALDKLLELTHFGTYRIRLSVFTIQQAPLTVLCLLCWIGKKKKQTKQLQIKFYL